MEVEEVEVDEFAFGEAAGTTASTSRKMSMPEAMKTMIDKHANEVSC